jgi:hypothetical protein
MKKKSRKRNSQLRKENSTVLLFTNGKTEEIYFKEFQRNENKSAMTVKPVFANGEMASFVTEIKAKLRNSDIYKSFSAADKVMFVFDFDGHSSEEITRTFKSLREIAGRKTEIYFSNFSFELWLLSHSKKVVNFKNQHQLQAELEKIYEIDKGDWNRHKTDKKLIGGIAMGWEIAINNCRHFSNELYQNYLENPWTNIGYLFDELSK